MKVTTDNGVIVHLDVEADITISRSPPFSEFFESTEASELREMLSQVSILGIAGRKQSGKDTAYRGLADVAKECGRTAHSCSFAHALKEACVGAFSMPVEEFYAPDSVREAEDPFWAKALGEPFSSKRRILQTIGTEVFRQRVHPDFWLFAFCCRALRGWESSRIKPGDILVFPDVRFTNESGFIRDAGGRVCRMVNLNLPPPFDCHDSERGIPDCHVDFEFHCSSELEARMAGVSLFQASRKETLKEWRNQIFLNDTARLPGIKAEDIQ